MVVTSTLEAGTNCHGYVTDCQGHVLFDRGVKDCSGTCLVSQRDNIPSDGPYCAHMIVHGNNGHVEETIKVDENACFRVDGKVSKWTFKKIRCTKKLPNPCGDPK